MKASIDTFLRTRLHMMVFVLTGILGISFLAPRTLEASTATVTAVADNYLKKDNKNKNKGSDTVLKISEAALSHVLIRFDQAAIAAAIGTGTLVEARLKLYIEQNWGGWTTPGRRVEIHRMTSDWTEMGSTWNCANDTDPSNSVADCATQWVGGAYVAQETDHTNYFDGTIGWNNFNVTSDVAQFLSGSVTNYGWLIRKQDTSLSGDVDISSLQSSNSDHRPYLLLTINFGPPECHATPSPGPNQYGWNNSNVTVTCSCSDPDGCTVTGGGTFGEGAAQVAGCSAEDSLGANTPCGVTLNIDKTPPAVAISFPSDQSELVGSAVTAAGTVQDFIGSSAGGSGINGVTCNSASGEVGDGIFSSDVTLSMGGNTVSCQASDFAGNAASDTVEVTRVSQQTYTFITTEDTYLDSAYPDTNFGDATSLEMGGPPNSNHVLVKFSQDDIQAAIRDNHVVSAYLELYEESNGNDWGAGAYIDVYRVFYEWEEMSATWNCPNASCDDSWSGGFHVNGFSDTLFYQNNESGWKTYNLTSDVQLVQNGENALWLLKKRDEGAYGTLAFTSAEDSVTLHPRLVVTVDDQATAVASVDRLYPGVVPSDGSSETITLAGQNLDHITEIFVDGSPVSFSLIDSSSITFDQAYFTSGDHQITMISDSLIDPINSYTITSDSTLFNGAQPTPPDAPTATTHFTKGNAGYLFYNNVKVFLSGYSSFNTITLDKYFDNSQDGTEVSDYMNTLQYANDTNPNATERHGVNLTRIAVFGDNNVQDQQDCQTMPLASGANGYRWDTLTTPYKNRLKATVGAAHDAGIAIQLSIFSGDHLMGNRTNWADNPLNPDHSWIDEKCGSVLPAGDSRIPFPEFYDICNVADVPCPQTKLKCLGLQQKALVTAVLNTVLAAPGGGENIIFEIMNEAPTAGSTSGTALDKYVQWHATVGQWIHNKGFLSSASLGVDATYSNLNSCGSGCSNVFKVFKSGNNVDIVSLHAPTWLANGVCSTAEVALGNFSKPVIIDDDGNNAITARANDNTVLGWANQAKGCKSPIGKVHFNHLDGGIIFTTTCTTGCTENNECLLDCGALDAMGDAVPSCLRPQLNGCAAGQYTASYCGFE